MADQNHTTDSSSPPNGGSNNTQTTSDGTRNREPTANPDQPLAPSIQVPRREEAQPFHQQLESIETAEDRLADERRNEAMSASGLRRPPPGRMYLQCLLYLPFGSYLYPMSFSYCLSSQLVHFSG